MSCVDLMVTPSARPVAVVLGVGGGEFKFGCLIMFRPLCAGDRNTKAKNYRDLGETTKKSPRQILAVCRTNPHNGTDDTTMF